MGPSSQSDGVCACAFHILSLLVKGFDLLSLSLSFLCIFFWPLVMWPGGPIGRRGGGLKKNILLGTHILKIRFDFVRCYSVKVCTHKHAYICMYVDSHQALYVCQL